MPSCYYERVCSKCGDTSTVTYKPKPGVLCRSCSKSVGHSNAWVSRPKVRYWYFCHSCNSIRVTGQRRKSNYCTECSRVASKRKVKITFDLDTMQYILPVRYFKVCKTCEEVVQVFKKSDSGFINACNDCKKAAKLNKSIPKLNKPNKPKTRGVDKKIVERERAKNKLHREFIAEQESKVEDIPVQKKSDEEMMKEWLKNNKPTIIEPLSKRS